MNLRPAVVAAATLLSAIAVVDGDTVSFEGRNYRLLGCDAPETLHAKCQREYDWGMRATKRLEQLLQSTEPRLVPNGRQCGYGRPCARLYLDGRDACHILIEEGLARDCGARRCVKVWCD